MTRSDEYPKRQEEPVVSKPSSTGGGHNGVVETHPAFGVAVVTRSSGSPRSLFQSDVLHHQVITLSIQTADRTRDLNHDWVHSRDTLVEVELSLAQWGALVSSVGLGSGVPVTIRRTESRAFVPTLPYQPRIKASLGEVTGSIDKLFARAKETLETLADAIENKKGVRAVRDALRMHSSTITNASNNSEFAVTSLAEAGEKVTSQVRADIESQILAAARLTGNRGAINAPEIHLDAIENPIGTSTAPTPSAEGESP